MTRVHYQRYRSKRRRFTQERVCVRELESERLWLLRGPEEWEEEESAVQLVGSFSSVLETPDVSTALPPKSPTLLYSSPPSAVDVEGGGCMTVYKCMSLELVVREQNRGGEMKGSGGRPWNHLKVNLIDTLWHNLLVRLTKKEHLLKATTPRAGFRSDSNYDVYTSTVTLSGINVSSLEAIKLVWKTSACYNPTSSFKILTQNLGDPCRMASLTPSDYNWTVWHSRKCLQEIANTHHHWFSVGLIEQYVVCGGGICNNEGKACSYQRQSAC